MAPRNDFEERYFDQLDENFKDIKKSLKENNRLVGGMDKRLRKVEGKVFPAQVESVKELPSIWRDPQFIKLLTYLSVAIIVALVIFAALKGISLPKGLLS